MDNNSSRNNSVSCADLQEMLVAVKMEDGPPGLLSLDQLGMGSRRSSCCSSAVSSVDYTSGGDEETYGSCTSSANTITTTATSSSSSSSFGKRRKTSRLDSPNSPVFDVALLVDAIHREIDGGSEDYNEDDDGNNSDDDTFCFVDISESAPASTAFHPNLADEEDLNGFSSSFSKLTRTTTTLPRTTLGKRSRGLVRSQTISTDLCMLG